MQTNGDHGEESAQAQLQSSELNSQHVINSPIGALQSMMDIFNIDQNIESSQQQTQQNNTVSVPSELAGQLQKHQEKRSRKKIAHTQSF